MSVITLLIIVSGGLATMGVVFFVWLVRQRSHEHIDRLAFLPLEDNSTTTPATGTLDKPNNRN